MRFRQMPAVSFRAVRRLVGAVILLSLVAVTPTGVSAQEIPSTGITVVGLGEASAAADTAQLQLLIVPGDIFGVPVEESDADASPTTQDVDMAEELAPVVEAIVAEGIDESAISVVVSPFSGDRFGRGQGSAGRIDLTVAQPTRDSLDALLQATSDAAVDQGLLLNQVGIAYELVDCAAIEREARQAAIEDARARAEIQAELLGVEIGPITASFDSPYAGLGVGGGCGFSDEGSFFSEGYGLPVTLPSYDPGTEPEIEIYVLLFLTFAIAQG